MSTYYVTQNNIAITGYSRTSAVAEFGKAIVTQQYPQRIPVFTGDIPSGYNPLDSWEMYIPKIENALHPVLILEDPIERFKKYYDSVKDVHSLDFALQIIEGAVPSIVNFLTDVNKVYRIDLHKQELEDLLDVSNVEIAESDLELTDDQEELLRKLYAADYEIYNSITAPGQTYIKPSPPQHVPTVLTTRQFWLAALEYGYDRDDIIAMVESLPESDASEILFKKTAKIDLHTAIEYRRDNATLNALSKVLGVTSSQLDQIFINGELL